MAKRTAKTARHRRGFAFFFIFTIANPWPLGDPLGTVTLW